MNRIYEGSSDSWGKVLSRFDVKEKIEEPENVYADYSIIYYEGYAVVVFTNDNKNFYAVFGSHCSCYGLEGQWDVEGPYTKKEIKLFVKDKKFEVWLDEVS